MKILNIHGYHGSAENSAYTALQKLNCEIISPQLDYDKENPIKILEFLKETTTKHKPDIVVGTSFGGFFATLLCTEMHFPAILINPSLMPFLILPELNYTRPVQPLIHLFGKLSELDSNMVSCIIGAEDEIIINHTFTKKLLANSRFRVVPDGKHSGATLPLESYFKEVLSFYSR